MDRCFLRDNHATWIGAGIYTTSSTAVVRETDMLANSASDVGGIRADRAALTVLRCTVAGNKGEAIYASLDTLTETDCSIVGNRGSGLVLINSSASFAGCTIASNTGGSGGGIYQQSWACSVVRTILWGNCAPYGDQIYTLEPVYLTCCDQRNITKRCTALSSEVRARMK